MAKLPKQLAKAEAEGWSHWIKSDADDRAVLAGCYFDQDAADQIVTFFEK